MIGLLIKSMSKIIKHSGESFKLRMAQLKFENNLLDNKFIQNVLL